MKKVTHKWLLGTLWSDSKATQKVTLSAPKWLKVRQILGQRLTFGVRVVQGRDRGRPQDHKVRKEGSECVTTDLSILLCILLFCLFLFSPCLFSLKHDAAMWRWSATIWQVGCKNSLQEITLKHSYHSSLRMIFDRRDQDTRKWRLYVVALSKKATPCCRAAPSGGFSLWMSWGFWGLWFQTRLKRSAHPKTEAQTHTRRRKRPTLFQQKKRQMGGGGGETYRAIFWGGEVLQRAPSKTSFGSLRVGFVWSVPVSSVYGQWQDVSKRGGGGGNVSCGGVQTVFGEGFYGMSSPPLSFPPLFVFLWAILWEFLGCLVTKRRVTGRNDRTVELWSRPATE